jgi:hypothetical protein
MQMRNWAAERGMLCRDGLQALSGRDWRVVGRDVGFGREAGFWSRREEDQSLQKLLGERFGKEFRGEFQLGPMLC